MPTSLEMHPQFNKLHTKMFINFICKFLSKKFLCCHVFFLAETPPPAYSPQDDSLHGSESNHQSMDTATLSAGTS